MKDDKKSKKAVMHNIAKVFQLLFFTALFFCGSNVLFKYLSLQLKSINNKSLPDNYYAFKTEYLYNGLNLNQPYAVIGLSFILAVFVVIRLDMSWQVKYGNENIKSDDRWMSLKELKDNFYPCRIDKMHKAEKGGIMVSLKGKKAYLDTENIHTLVIGTTRSGKGQTIILPLIWIISAVKEKQSFITNDMKGDNLESTYSILKDNGYRIFVLNLDDASRSDEWDLLYEAKREYLKVIKDDEPDLSACTKIIDSIASLFTDNPKSDPIWPDSAHALLVAMILYMIEQGYKTNKLDKVTMPSVYHFFVNYGSHDEIRNNMRFNALDEIFKNLPPDNPAKASYASSNFAKGEMRASIFSTLATNLKIFAADMGVQKITSGNTVEFSKLVNDDKPCAVFIILPDEDRSRDVIASAFINQSYDYLVKQAKKHPKKYLPRRIQFVLDEFANMPRIPAMDNKTSIGAGHNILFTLVIQDLNQLDDKYGSAAKSIRGTCGNLIYINSIDKDTNSYISSILGNQQYDYKTYSGNLREWLSHQDLKQETKPLLTASQLGRLKKNTAVVIRQRCYPILAKLKPFYKFKFPITPITDIPLHKITRKVRESLYPIKDFQASIGMEVIKETTKTPALNSSLSGILSVSPDDNTDILDIESEQQMNDDKLQAVVDKLDKSTDGLFTEAWRSNDITRAEKIAKNECKLKHSVTKEELDMVLAELSQFY